MMQRMGRTGRKRAGMVYILLMEGSEEAKYKANRNKQSRIQLELR